MQIHLGIDIRQTNCPERHKGALGRVLGGQTFNKSQGKLSNGWTDWHQLWFTSADSSGNGHRLNTSHPSIPQGACRGLGGHTFKSLGKLSNGWTYWHQLWFTSADSFGNGHRLNTSHPAIPQWACRGGGLGCHTFIRLGKLSNGWTDCHQMWYTSVDSSGNGQRLKQLAPRYPRAALWVVLWDQQFKRLGNCGQKAERIGIQFCTYNADESGNGQRLNKLAP